MRIRRVLYLVIALILCLPGVGQGRPVNEGVAANVNDQLITVTDVLSTMQSVERQLYQTYKGAELERKIDEAYRETLNTLIERALIVDAFKQLKDVSLPDTIISSRIDEIIRIRFNNNRNDLFKALESDGITFDEWKDSLRRSVIVSIMKDREVDKKISITPQAIRAAYEKDIDTYRVPAQVDLRMIVIHHGVTPEENEKKLKLASDVHARLTNGENFEQLAKDVSEGPKASTGGNIGWIDPTTRRTELADAIKALPPGTTSKIIDTGEDYYILRIEGRRDASEIPFEKVQDTIRADLQKKEIKRLYAAWIQRLKQASYVYIVPTN